MAIAVADERYLQELVACIHLNPLAPRTVTDPARYRWSGHSELLGRVVEPLADINEALVLFGGRREAARRTYARILRGDRQVEWIGEQTGRLPWCGAEATAAELALPAGRALARAAVREREDGAFHQRRLALE